MRSLLLVGPMMTFALAASAQTTPSAPGLPSAGMPATPNVPGLPSTGLPATPSMPGLPSTGMPATPSVTGLPGGAPTIAAPGANSAAGASLPAAGQAPSPIDKAKTEAECKIPTNAMKSECIALRLKQ
jgi:hypothetical protein